jgi:hypothetical protein
VNEETQVRIRILHLLITAANKERQEICNKCGHIFCGECPLGIKAYQGADSDVCDSIEDVAHQMDLVLQRMEQGN